MEKFLSSSSAASEQVDDLLSQFSDETIFRLGLPFTGLSTAASLPRSSSPSSTDDAGLPSELSARFAKLRLPVREKGMVSDNGRRMNEEAFVNSPSWHDSQEEDDVVGSDLARRLAALKAIPSSKENIASSLPSSNDDLPFEPSAALTRPLGFESSDAEQQTKCQSRGSDEVVETMVSDVNALLASFSNEVRAERSLLKQKKRGNGRSVLQGACQSDEEISDAEVEKVVEWAKDAARLDISESEDEELSLETMESDKDIVLQSIKDDYSIGKRKDKRWSFWGKHNP